MAKGKTEARLKGKEKDNSQLPCQQEIRDPISMMLESKERQKS